MKSSIADQVKRRRDLDQVRTAIEARRYTGLETLIMGLKLSTLALRIAGERQMEEFPEILQLVCTYLNENNINYVIVGGVAVMYHGVPRTTVDIDLILQMEDEQISPFTEFLNSKGFAASATDIRAAFNEQSHSTSFFRDTLLRLDIQGINSDFDEMTLDRAILVDLFGTSVRIGSAEDALVNKILFQGEQDMRDALGILKRNHENLDFEYIRSTCRILGILDFLEQFLKDSEGKKLQLSKTLLGCARHTPSILSLFTITLLLDTQCLSESDVFVKITQQDRVV